MMLQTFGNKSRLLPTVWFWTRLRSLQATAHKKNVVFSRSLIVIGMPTIWILTDQKWIKSYPDSGYHGGGLPILTRVAQCPDE